jgi:short-subunit dehydrogenase
MSTKEVVVITGATAGIGRALARRFAREGAKIALLARGPHKLAKTLTEVIDLGGEALAIEIDVADPDAVEDAAKQIEQDLGPIDIWINNAAVGVFGRINDMTPKEIQRVTDVNYHGAVWGTKAALTRMKKRGRGTIVQVGSVLGYRALPLLTAYSAAKFALRGFTEGLRVELLHDGIDVHLTMVHLPAINTPFFTWARNLMPRQPRPLPPIYQPEIAADVIHWAAHSRRRDVFMGLSTVAAITANKLAPALLDRLLAWFAVDFQQTSEPTPLDQDGNLFEPVEVDLGIHGKFDAFARSRAPLAKLIARLSGAGFQVLVVGTAVVLVGRALFR